MAKAQLDFSGARGIIDPLEGLRASMQQASTNLGQMIIQDETRVRQARQDARQDKQDLLATPGTPEWLAAQKAQQEMKIGGLSAEQQWKMQNDPVYQNALAAVKRETPGTPEWTEAQKALQNMKLQGLSAELELKKKIDPVYQAQINALSVAENDRKGRELLAKEIMGLPTETVTKTEITPAQREAAKIGLESAAVVNAGDVYNKEFAKLRTPVTVAEPVLVEGYEVTPGKTAVMSEEEAHQEALKRAGLLDVVAGKAPVINEGLLPKVGVTESKKTLTAEELTQAKLNATIKAAQEGKVPAALALEVATKLTPVKTSKEKIDEAKFGLDVDEFKAKKEAGYWDSHKKGPDDGSGKAIRTALNDMFETHGKPDLVGTGDRADMEEKLAKLQTEKGYSDAQMASAIEKARGIYGKAWFGVNEDGFIEAVKEGLGKLQPPKK